MTFANGWLLTVAAAAAIPITIHLWRRRRGEIRWAAMSLLRSAMERQARSRRWSHWLLMLWRCLMIIVLAFAVAAPYRTIESRQASTNAEQKTLSILLVDDSLSTQYKEENETTFDRLRSELLNEIRVGGHGDAFCLVPLTDPAHPLVATPAFDRDALRKAILAMKPSEKNEQVEQSIRAALELARQYSHDPRFERIEIRLFTDLAGTFWNEKESPIRDLEILLAEYPFTIIPCGNGERANVGIVNLQSPSSIFNGQVLSVQCTIASFGSDQQSIRQLTFTVDDTVVEQRKIEIDPHQTKEVLFEHRFEKSGFHSVTVSIDRDSLSQDDQRQQILFVRDSMNVLLIEGRNGEAERLAIALESAGHRYSVIKTRIVDYSSWRFDSSQSYEIVAFCNVPQLTFDDVEKLEKLLADGTSVVVSCGDLIEADKYDRLRFAGGSAVLPVELIKESDFARINLNPLGYAHALFHEFKNQTNAGLLDAPIWKYWQSRLRKDERPTELLRVGNSHPILVSKNHKRGKIVIFLSSWSQHSKTSVNGSEKPWSALDIWWSFVPMTQQLFAWSATRQFEHHTIEVGDHFSKMNVDQVQSLELKSKRGKGVVCEKSGITGEWTSRPVDQSGLYQPVKNGEPSSYEYAVNVPGQQSDVRRFSVDRLPKKFVDDPDYEESASYSTHRRHWLVKPLLWLLLFFVLVEVVWVARLDQQ